MLFNTISFAIFLPIVLVLYWFVFNKNIKAQNLVLLASSYYFYSCWDFRFLGLLVLTTLIGYFIGLKINQSDIVAKRKLWMQFGVVLLVVLLGVFKYFNFFIESFTDGLNFLGIKTDYSITLNIILPVGISFYIFHSLSYIIDVYKYKVKTETDLITYSVFVGYFPLLVAGPIERATHLLPQLKIKKFFSASKFSDGLRQILWGLFKKVVIADQCAVYVDMIFENSDHYNGSTLFLGIILFAFQIYGDFSGYSDIALGTSRLFGIELIKNFSFPFFSRDVAEFWRRWHISLSSWFKDYVYIPLGGSRVSKNKQIRNIFIIFLLSGFWHGANWTFIFWGFINALYFLPLLIFNLNRTHLDIVAKDRWLPSFVEAGQMTMTFLLTALARVFFRSETLSQAFSYLNALFSLSFFEIPDIFPESVFGLIIIFIIVEWNGRRCNFAIENFLFNKNKFVRWLFYYIIIFTVFYFSNENNRQFIYFQF